MAVWDNVRIIAGTILGGAFGFYVMHRAEISYKEKMNERLRQYQSELEKKDKLNKIEESI
ncbi:ATP-dependent helicase/nuclease subunit A isoform 1 [Tripterygium wilfordii]|uniref:ATP-dependent helicase/nuclease subunit A isoform 1 n=1 Tax=Tripterygium wilfordii TaxID=458696 RepID=A0A7J7C8C0_TRIWF|nr:uncharacterized protein LOC119986687 [Tripterygium wilfordii]XP_038687278.1 uncharacterized protein LOC119986687 [Tripterygium wilfordii]KAF5730379.1 ATP-dependent helicase/nuclease subunit A isoform 1 [Tripterygium wilfordii]